MTKDYEYIFENNDHKVSKSKRKLRNFKGMSKIRECKC